MIDILNPNGGLPNWDDFSYGIIIKNSYLKLILLSDKRNIKIFKEVKHFYKICYQTTIASIGEGICDYNKLSEHDKEIIETIISLCY